MNIKRELEEQYYLNKIKCRQQYSYSRSRKEMRNEEIRRRYDLAFNNCHKIIQNFFHEGHESRLCISFLHRLENVILIH